MVRGEDGETSQQLLQRVCGWIGPSAASEAVAELVEARLLKRVSTGAGNAHRLVVVEEKDRKRKKACEVCGAPVNERMRGAKRCPACVQPQRREWKGDLLAIWHNAQALGWDDWKVAYTAHVRLKRPLWGRSEEGVAGSGSGDGEGVVNAGVALGIFPSTMLDNARRARRGEEGE